jgi:hypothetical protein
MITLAQYFGPHATCADRTPQIDADATVLLGRVNAALAELEKRGAKCPVNPKTKSQVSGTTFGGFRPQDCPQGRPDSSHKQGQGVDLYDPFNAIDNAIDDDLLERHDLYREHPKSTDTWCHLTTRAPKSRRRTFFP